MLFLLQTVRPIAEPLFTNDIVGIVKILVILYGSVMLPLAALVVYFLKRGPDAAVAQLRTDFNGLGGTVSQLKAELSATNERVNMVYSQIAESQRDIMTAIQASSEAQIRATHLVELEVARLQERNNLGDSLRAFGTSIERLIDVVVATHPRAD